MSFLRLNSARENYIVMQINFVVGDPSKNAAGESCRCRNGHGDNRSRISVLVASIAAIRASMGHPEPFKLRFVEIGNEDFFAADTYAAYRWREFVTALSAQFPSIGTPSHKKSNYIGKFDKMKYFCCYHRVSGNYKHIQPCPHSRTTIV